MSKILLIEKQNAILRLTLNRPESFNALNFEMLSALQKAFVLAEEDAGVRVILLSGAGKAFCAGGDVKFFSQILDQSEEEKKFSIYQMPTQLHEMALRMKRVKKPVICAVNGPAVGAGFALAALGDLVVASKSAYFNLAYFNIGLSPDGSSTFSLPKILGTHKTFSLLATGKNLSVEEANALGLVTEVFEDAEFESQTLAFAKKIATLPTQALAQAKRLVFEGMANSFETQLNWETEAVRATALSKDFLEGVTAFVEKRKPKFRGI
ncbi:MAG: enoyl-CoA hydratase/isomerase family protein [Deltaproteobacteria bacterium]|nr:enoyl-CoA hydratase/isomerase family protein [Deltaproteobacteria bacterium]